jgi:hypothetical protein
VPIDGRDRQGAVAMGKGKALAIGAPAQGGDAQRGGGRR